jgi:hypothetical protein
MWTTSLQFLSVRILFSTSEVNTLSFGITSFGSAWRGKIQVEFVRSEEQLADLLTKALGRVKLHEQRAKIGMIEIEKMHKVFRLSVSVNCCPSVLSATAFFF